MRRTLHIAAILLLTAGIVAVGATPAAAAAPSNDEIANAVTLGRVPFIDTVNTEEATNWRGRWRVYRHCFGMVQDHTAVGRPDRDKHRRQQLFHHVGRLQRLTG